MTIVHIELSEFKLNQLKCGIPSDTKYKYKGKGETGDSRIETSFSSLVDLFLILFKKVIIVLCISFQEQKYQ